MSAHLGQLSGSQTRRGSNPPPDGIPRVTNNHEQRRVIRDCHPRHSQYPGSPLSGGGARSDRHAERVHDMTEIDPLVGNRDSDEEGWTLVTRKRKRKDVTCDGQPDPQPENEEQPGTLTRGQNPGTGIGRPRVRHESLYALRGRMGPNLVRAVVCWTPQFETDEVFWQRIVRCMNEGALCKHIIKITSVKQKNDLSRFDIWVERGYEDLVLKKAKAHQHKWGWYCREHVAYRIRAARVTTGVANRGSRARELGPPPRREQRGTERQRRNGATTGRTNLNPGNNLGPRVGTLNINGIREKKTDLQFYLEERGIQCLALQETLLRATDWKVRIPGYHCFTMCGEHGASIRGVSMLVSKRMSGYVVGKGSAWHLCVRVFGENLRRPWILCSVYIPSKRDGNDAIDHLVNDMNRIGHEYPTDPIVLMGDWNREEEEVTQLVGRCGGNFRVLPLQNGEEGTRKGSSTRKIDLMAAKLPPHVFVEDPEVDRMLDISDHYPVYSRLREVPDQSEAITGARGRRHKTLDRRRIYPENVPVQGSASWRRGPGKATHLTFVSSNYWDALKDISFDEDPEEREPDKGDVQALADGMADAWVEAAHKVSKATGMANTKGTGRFGLAPKLRQAIKRRTDLFQEAKKCAPGSEDAQKLWMSYDEARTRTRELVKDDKRVRWGKALGKAADNMRNNPREYWKWAAGLAGWKLKEATNGMQPVRHPDTQEVLTQEGPIRDAWALHFERLAADPTGNSRNPTKWANWIESSPHQHMEKLDRPISVEEIEEAIKRMKRCKAPGADGIPADLLKLACLGEENSFLLTIHSMINFMFKHGVIPGAWCQSVVVAIPKKGDPTDMNNYRGISLMGSVLKLLMIVISGRLNEAMEAGGLFSQSQAGFRKSEECITQVACLVELCRRRRLEDRPTYLTFIDLKKAYDTVPHEALMAKLHYYGVRGRTLKFIRELYTRSTIAVRCGDGTSEPVPLKRGVRQGCPLSPVLFNVFINDILDDTGALGVPMGTQRVPGLLFADDLVCTTPNRMKTEQLNAHLSRWLRDNEMTVGIQKCGIMVVGGDQARLIRKPERWKLGVQTIPIVEEYTYLGINFHRDLLTSSMMRGRLGGARELVRKMAPFMLHASIPAPMKVAVIKAIVHPRLMFGAEVYGMNKRITRAMQKYLNQICKMAIGVRGSSPISNVALWRELDMPPVCASAAARRARAIQKSYQLSTFITRVVRTPFKNQCKTWLTGGIWWMKRYLYGMARKYPELLHDVDPMVFRDVKQWRLLGVTTLKRTVQKLVWRREEDAAVSAAGLRYIGSQFELNRLTSVRAVGCPVLARGIAMILRLRLEGWWTCSRLANVGLLPRRYQDYCPCCKVKVPETVQHVLLHCPRWKSGRDRLLGDLVVEARRRWRCSSSASPNILVTLLLGGRVQGELLSNWSIDGFDAIPTDSQLRGSPGLDEGLVGKRGEFMDSPWILSRGCLRVGSFLAWVMRERSFIIREVRAKHGLSFTATILRPNG